jgi:hypothetical protein
MVVLLFLLYRVFRMDAFCQSLTSGTTYEIRSTRCNRGNDAKSTLYQVEKQFVSTNQHTFSLFVGLPAFFIPRDRYCDGVVAHYKIHVQPSHSIPSSTIPTISSWIVQSLPASTTNNITHNNNTQIQILKIDLRSISI